MVRKRSAPETTVPLSEAGPTKKSSICLPTVSAEESNVTDDPVTNVADSDAVDPPAAGLYCIGILPGIGKYTESSDSEKSTDTDEEYDYSSYDWVGRRVKKDDHDHSKCSGSHWFGSYFI